jgi:hypothetical protein
MILRQAMLRTERAPAIRTPKREEYFFLAFVAVHACTPFVGRNDDA